MGTAAAKHPSTAQHVLLISVDGLHQTDLAFYVKAHPKSELAKLVGSGDDFTQAETPVPSDSFPGLIAQVTGGNPSSTGIYYDDSYNNVLLPAGTTNCATTPPGVEVTYFEQLDRNPHALDAGQGLAGLPGSILHMTGDPRTLIDTTQLPVDPVSCQPVFPHSYLKVNTIFEVARAAGMRTAWSDKHPAYEILNGPSGLGVQDLFTPEINSDAPTLGSPNDWTNLSNLLTQQYDSYKVQAVLNEIRGFDHSGTSQVGVPALFGMNFQTVSTAQKLPTSEGRPGGYLADGATPGPVLMGALDYINTQIGAMVSALQHQRLDKTTTIILSAKHGQSPQTPSALTRIPDGPIVSALNAAWHAAHPTASNPLVVASVNDDAMVMWFSDHSDTAALFARNFLLNHSGTGNDINGAPRAYTASGLSNVFAGGDAASYFGVSRGDARVPDLYGIVQYGVVYTGGHGKIAEHGGANPQDRNVPLVISGGPVHHRVNAGAVETTQIAPTILQLLGLPANALQAVQIERTRALPIS
ncbi:MAG TPA: alkaline phosphatase family protein [Candidatus Dormibacteraeota bacterium]|nr:alkaline phosphatase family protein [Candidatus Dormibacteraeota bacterium]